MGVWRCRSEQWYCSIDGGVADITVYYSSPASLQIANVLGQLRKTGWRPGRTLVLCSWDAEEFSLMGSTEWAQVCVLPPLLKYEFL